MGFKKDKNIHRPYRYLVKVKELFLKEPLVRCAKFRYKEDEETKIIFSSRFRMILEYISFKFDSTHSIHFYLFDILKINFYFYL